MSQQFDEVIAMSCPDIESQRRSSIVKPMTSTELAAARTAMIEREKREKAINSSNKTVAATKKSPSTESTSTATSSTASSSTGSSSATPSSTASSATSDDDTASVTIKTKLPTLPAPPDRISSLPNLLGKSVEEQRLNRVVSVTQKSKQAAETEETSNSKSSIDDYETAKGTSIADSIELLRMQRREREHRRERDRSYTRSHSPDIQRRHDHERSAAPDRLDSSSLSSSGSAVSTSASASTSTSTSASTSVTTSKSTSRRGSTVSYTAEATNAQLPPTPRTPPAPIANSQLAKPTFPILKPNSTPNLERRNSNLSTLFPGASQLTATEPSLHTDPKIFEKAFKAAEKVKEQEKVVKEQKEEETSRGKFVHRTKTPPPLSTKLGVSLKKVTPPRTQITVRKNPGPMLGVVLRKVEKQNVPQRSILDDDKPLYHFSIVRSDHKEYKPEKPKPKPKPKPAIKPNPGGILTGPRTTHQAPVINPKKPQIGVPITIQKIEGDKIIIIKKILIPKNGKIPEQYLKVGPSTCNMMWCPVICSYVLCIPFLKTAVSRVCL